MIHLALVLWGKLAFSAQLKALKIPQETAQTNIPGLWEGELAKQVVKLASQPVLLPPTPELLPCHTIGYLV